ncbi:hypothetical protein NKR23_g11064 [Pleurostoma richardsiae]|uniref:Ubiquitin-protein ligase sel1 n=1 Tax=Pleurostoma richardsiae TaxID=41990 RepID=A0AA38RBI0_9PEZI|nr:hypothetical protein NKR23_g11064 [Pleurostoma richardsiae]
MDSSRLIQRDDVPYGFVEENGRLVPFWYSRTGVIVKWSVFLGLFTIIGLYLLIGYTHAKRRMRKGLPPLAYHRWLVSKAELARVDPRYAYPQPAGYSNYRPDYYGMQPQPFAAPPPVYDPNAPRPPIYDGPEGATKVAPSQYGNQPTYRPADQDQAPMGDDFAPPPGPPPAVTANHTGSSNNPYRPGV